MYSISVSTKGAEPTTHVVDRDLLVGRARDCGLSIADQRLSRQHAKLMIRVLVEVSDNGPGIPADVAARIFEPFFSTKGEQGLGLGLDISRKIVIDHGGLLTFESEVGKGTTFRIALPSLGH